MKKVKVRESSHTPHKTFDVLHPTTVSRPSITLQTNTQEHILLKSQH